MRLLKAIPHHSRRAPFPYISQRKTTKQSHTLDPEEETYKAAVMSLLKLPLPTCRLSSFYTIIDMATCCPFPTSEPSRGQLFRAFEVEGCH